MVLRVDQGASDGVAAQLEAAADQFTGEVDRLISNADSLDWSGMSREAFLTSLREMKPQFQQMVEGCIKGSGQKLRQSVQALMDADSSVAQGMST
jgi:WXG100 family type VII secretion target